MTYDRRFFVGGRTLVSCMLIIGLWLHTPACIGVDQQYPDYSRFGEIYPGAEKGTFYLLGEREIFSLFLVFAQHTGRDKRL
jgi:hypothetical protein